MKPVIIGGYNQNYETVVASKYKTITKTIEFDRAATLEIHFNGLQKDGSTVIYHQ